MHRRPLALVPATAAALLGGCGAAAPPPPPPPPAVTVAVPVQRDVTTYREFTGNADAVESVEIRARVQGFLQEKMFEDGSIVKAGQKLFIIEQEPYEREVERLAAEKNAAEVELEQAKFDLGKTEELAAQEAATEKQLNDARIAVARAEAALAAAEASLTQAQLNLEYTTVVSPIAGRVSRNYVDVGNLVGAGENTLLTTVVQMAPIYIYFEVDEATITQALAQMPVEQRFRPKPGQRPFFVALPGADDFAYEGSLDYTDNTVDPETGTIVVRGKLTNEERLFIPGQFVRVRVPVADTPDAVLVEERAIGSDLGGKFLLIVNGENVCEHRQVELGQLEGTLRVIREGIAPGERYIVDGLQMARPGRPVTVTGEAPPPGTPADSGTGG